MGRLRQRRPGQRRLGQTRPAGWRRTGARLALIALVFEALIGLGGALGGMAAAADGTPAGYIEICTPTGIQWIAWDGVPPVEEPDGPADRQTAKAPCIVCAALGACPVACLDFGIAVDWRPAVAFLQPRDREIAVPARACPPKRSRAPPLSV